MVVRRSAPRWGVGYGTLGECLNGGDAFCLALLLIWIMIGFPLLRPSGKWMVRRPYFGMIFGLAQSCYASLLSGYFLFLSRKIMWWALWILGRGIFRCEVLGGGVFFGLGRRNFSSLYLGLCSSLQGSVRRMFGFGNRN